MVTKCYHELTQIPCSDGEVLKFLAKEESDSGTVLIPNVQRILFNAFDNIYIEILNDSNELLMKKYFVLSTFDEQVSNFKDATYTYTLSLVSPLARLERVQTPNRKFTPRDNRTVLWQCNQILSYIKKQYNSNACFSQRFIDHFGAIIGVEKQFNNPNAKEALNSLVAIDNCIITMTNYITIDYIKLDEKGDAIDQAKLFMESNSQNSVEYASTLRVSAKNCQSNETNVYQELIGARCLNSAVLTTENASFNTQHPIDVIDKCEWYIYTGNANQPYIKIDLVNNSYINGNILIEKKEYDLKKNSVSPAVVEDLDYKRCHVYYQRGSNQISGFNYSDNSLLNNVSAVGTAIQNIVTWICDEMMIQHNSQIDIRRTKLMVTYKSLESVQFNSNKTKNVWKSIILNDNQTEDYVNLDDFGKSQALKVNRIGNPYKIITSIYSKISDVPKLMDYIDDYILTDIEMSINDNQIVFKGILYKNFCDLDMFYGVDTKRRTYKIATDGFVNREEIKEVDICLSSQNANGDYKTLPNFCSYVFNYNNVSVPFNSYNEYSKRSLGYGVGRSKYSDGTYSNYFIIKPYLAKCGMSVLLNMKFFDNFSVGVCLSSDIQTTGGFGQEYIPYVDENGELIEFDLYVFDYFNLDLTSSTTNFYLADSLPKLSSLNQLYNMNDLALGVAYAVDKDQQEKLDFNLQINFKSSDENIIITDAFVKRIAGTKGRSYLSVWYSSTNKFKASNINASQLATQIIDGSVEIDYTSFNQFNNSVYPTCSYMKDIKLYKQSSVDTSTWKSYCIAENDGTILIAVNRDSEGNLPMTLYFNQYNK